MFFREILGNLDIEFNKYFHIQMLKSMGNINKKPSEIGSCNQYYDWYKIHICTLVSIFAPKFEFDPELDL